jgi:hypothetical protein
MLVRKFRSILGRTSTPKPLHHHIPSLELVDAFAQILTRKKSRTTQPAKEVEMKCIGTNRSLEVEM